ncbi:MAG: dihydrodipicolinate synthase family protein [Bryobacteraceae bacterium]
MPQTLPQPLRGIVPPMATPLTGRDTLDLSSLERLVERLIAARVSGLFVLGTTGEAPGLSLRMRAEIVERVCSITAGRVPVLVSVTDTSAAETLNAARHAAQVGASGLVLAPPYYFTLSQPELLGYLRRISPDLPLPVYLYNIPSLTKTHFTPETVAEAAELPNVYGLKDSSGDMAYFAQVARVLAQRPDFTLLCGPEELLAESIALGGHGGIAGGSNLAPELYVGLYEAALNHETERIHQMQATILQISRRIYHVKPEGSSYLRGLKCALSLLGYGRNVMAEPYEAYGPAETAGVREALIEIGLLK